jgi:hypothetical protein
VPDSVWGRARSLFVLAIVFKNIGVRLKLVRDLHAEESGVHLRVVKANFVIQVSDGSIGAATSTATRYMSWNASPRLRATRSATKRPSKTRRCSQGPGRSACRFTAVWSQMPNCSGAHGERAYCGVGGLPLRWRSLEFRYREMAEETLLGHLRKNQLVKQWEGKTALPGGTSGWPPPTWY